MNLNAVAVLSLIADLYGQVAELNVVAEKQQERIAELEAELAKADKPKS